MTIPDPSAVTGLSRSDPHGPGISRVRTAGTFAYRDPAGAGITDSATLDRIRALALPPAWADVWISADPLGHIQATGTDARGRTQYRYHQRWREQRDAQKFEHMLRFAGALPGLRANLAHDVSAYIAGRAGGHFTAKESRTWNATVLMALQLANAGPSASARAASRTIAASVRAVAEWLGDTPAVARGSYIDPRLISRYESDGRLPAVPVMPPELPADTDAEAAVAAPREEPGGRGADAVAPAGDNDNPLMINRLVHA